MTVAATILDLFTSPDTVLTAHEVAAGVARGENHTIKKLYRLRQDGKVERFFPDPFRADRPAYRLPRKDS